jgi:hypothetical protein
VPYDVSSQTTKEYPAPMPPRGPVKAQAIVVDEPDIHVEYESPVDRAIAELSSPVPEGEPSQRLATGSGPAPADGTPLVHPDRKRAQSRPSIKTVLTGEIDTENELDVPTFIRRHSATHG